jgi:hypothetical protein
LSTTVAVFASDRIHGHAARANLFAQAGTLLARRGVRLVVPAIGGQVCMPLVVAAHGAGAETVIVAQEGFALPRTLEDVPIERPGDEQACQARVAELAQGYLVLPISLLATSFLYGTWVSGGGGSAGKPVAMLNQGRAFEVLRGYAADVLSHGLGEVERYAIFSEGVEDLWNRLARVIEQKK